MTLFFFKAFDKSFLISGQGCFVSWFHKVAKIGTLSFFKGENIFSKSLFSEETKVKSPGITTKSIFLSVFIFETTLSRKYLSLKTHKWISEITTTFALNQVFILISFFTIIFGSINLA
jgi:hypothetical protein